MVSPSALKRTTLKLAIMLQSRGLTWYQTCLQIAMFQANYIRCIYSPDNDNCKVTVWMIISFDVRLRRSNPIDFVHLTQLYGLFFKYWEVISIHNWDLCLYHRYLVPVKKVADASTVGSPSQWKIYVLFDNKYDRHKLYQKKESAWIKHWRWRHNMTS